jgi:chromosome segregation ATPase
MSAASELVRVCNLPAAGEISALQERLQGRDMQVTSLQQELSLLQLHVRDAQRAQGAAAEAQAAASKALDQQECELAALRQQLKEAQVSVQAPAGC